MFITNGGLVDRHRGRPEHAGRLRSDAQAGQRLGHVEPHCRIDPSFGHPGEVRSIRTSPSGSRRTTRLRRFRPPREDHRTLAVRRSPIYRRHRDRGGFELADELRSEPAAAVPQPAEGHDLGVDLRFVPRQTRRLHSQADAGLHRYGDLRGMALPRGRCPTGSRSSPKNQFDAVPVMMPYVDAFFMPRELGDHPDVVPDGACDFAFIGQFAEEPRDTDLHHGIFDAHRRMEAVYTLCNVDRGVPEVWTAETQHPDVYNAAVDYAMDSRSPPSDAIMWNARRLHLRWAPGRVAYRHAQGVWRHRRPRSTRWISSRACGRTSSSMKRMSSV